MMDSQNDTTPFTAETTNSAGQIIPGVPVTISVGTSVTWEMLSPDRSTTMVYDQNGDTSIFVDNATEAMITSVAALPALPTMALFSPDGTTVLRAGSNCAGQRLPQRRLCRW